jgi:hypothetical protein
MYRTYRDRASFAFVSIAEGHSVDGVAAGVDEDEGVLPPQHTSLAERFAAARKGAERPRLTLLVLVDGMTP